MKKLTAVVVGFTLCIIAGQAFGLQLTSDISHKDNIKAVNINARPLCFTENDGQFGEKTLYKAEAGGAAFYFCQDEVAYLFVRNTNELLDDIRNDETDARGLPDKFNQPRFKQEAMLVKAEFIGANQNAAVEGISRLPHNNNYFLGNDHSQWQTDVANYAMITYHDIYPGIELKYYGDNRTMKYDFIINPGADLSQIRIHYEGVSNLSVTPDGDLQASTDFGLVYEKVPYIYQEIGGTKQAVSGRYELIEPGVFGFAVDESYDPNRSLVIDPELVYSTYIGTIATEYFNDIAVDSDGNMYMTGTHSSYIFPEVNPYEHEIGNGYTLIITKMAATGDHLIFSTMIGGNHEDEGEGIAVDNQGYVYVAGHTYSPDFPLENALDDTYSSVEAFALKLAPEGNVLVYSTYIGGINEDQGQGVACDLSGNAYIVGYTRSADFPLHNSLFQYEQYRDAFVTKINSDGSAFIYSAILPGVNDEVAYAIVVDENESPYIAGVTGSPNFPVTHNYDFSFNDCTNPGQGDAFIMKLTPSGDALIFSNFLGGNRYDCAWGMTLDAEGYIYITGYVDIASENFPLVNPYDATKSSQSDGFIAKFTPDGNSLVFSSYLGGDGYDLPYDIAVDDAGNAYVVGGTSSIDLPDINGYFPDLVYGLTSSFLVKISTISSCLLFSTYWGGGAWSDPRRSVAVSGDYVYIAGEVRSDSLPTLNAYDPDNNGGSDCFVSVFHVPEVSIESADFAGTITDETSAAIEGADIRVLGLTYSGITDAFGEYSVTGLCPGVYDISVSHPFYCDTVITGVIANPGENVLLDVVMASGGALSGVITDSNSVQLEDVDITIEGTGISGTTDSDGEYLLPGICSGTYDVSFYKQYYLDTTITDVAVENGENTELNLTMSSASSYVTLWYGNTDLSPVRAAVGNRVYIDVYAQVSNADVSFIWMALAVSDSYFDCYTNPPDYTLHYPLNLWPTVNYFGPFNARLNPAGYSSYGLNLRGWQGPYLISDIPIKIMTFGFDVLANNIIIGDTLECLATGQDRSLTSSLPTFRIANELTAIPVYEYFSPVTFVEPSTFAYLPGDVNMANGGWPPAVIGSDVTYLVNYFRNLDGNPPCNFTGFFAPADINGDCRVIGSDVTRLVNYFRGQGTIAYCPDYEPWWHSSRELPTNPPPNWPGCDQND